ncbi:hypothetical protein BGZ76_009733 [Entomortierella beljakovae]|nr:hypothetical protein BGZ76_009733 [Entomortierella beljakovae]
MVADSISDSGILLDDDGLATWGSSAVAPSFKDPGLLILQVTRFGTIDHAFAIPQSDFNKAGVTISCDHPLFLAQNRASIESMANNSIMSQVHPHDLAELCYGLDQVCKSLYTSFHARWRVHSFDELSTDCEHAAISTYINDNDNNDEDDEVDNMKQASNLIEFQGVTYEEWIDPFAISGDQPTSSIRECGEYVWAEVTGVLSSGSPVLVVRPLTMAEAAAHEGFDEVPIPAPVNVPSRSYVRYDPYDPYDPYYDADSDDDEGYLEMEMEEESELNEDPAVIVDFRVYKDQSWRRMDHGEGLCLSHNNVQGLSDLGNSSGMSPGYPCKSSTKGQNSSRHSHRRTRVKPMMLPGLYRAGKVLEANYPALDGVVRQIGRSWIGQRIIARGRLEHKIDVVAEQVIDWLESKDRIVALTSSLPMYNALTTYTPLYFLTTKARN